jgi:hypothetical protein
MTEDEKSILEFVAMTAAQLKQVDQSTINKGTGGNASKLDINRYIPHNAQTERPRQQTNVSTKNMEFVDVPTERYEGSMSTDEPIYGTIDLIPIDKEMEKYISPTKTTAAPQVLQQTPGQVIQDVSRKACNSSMQSPELAFAKMEKRIMSLERAIYKLIRLSKNKGGCKCRMT